MMGRWSTMPELLSCYCYKSSGHVAGKHLTTAVILGNLLSVLQLGFIASHPLDFWTSVPMLDYFLYAVDIGSHFACSLYAFYCRSSIKYELCHATVASPEKYCPNENVFALSRVFTKGVKHKGIAAIPESPNDRFMKKTKLENWPFVQKNLYCAWVLFWREGIPGFAFP
eukprot:1274665-Amphidinium_carterae.1